MNVLIGPSSQFDQTWEGVDDVQLVPQLAASPPFSPGAKPVTPCPKTLSPTSINCLIRVLIQLESKYFALASFEDGSLDLDFPTFFREGCLDFHNLVTLGAVFLLYEEEAVVVTP